MSKLIQQCYVYSPHGKAKLQSVYISDAGEIAPIPLKLPQNTEVIEGHGKLAIMPGWIDAHVHGFGGVDFSDVDADIQVITSALAKGGVSYCAATLVSLEISKLKSALAKIDDYYVHQNYLSSPGSARIVAVHLEGPFIAHDCKGAHDANVLQTKISLAIFKDIIAAAPHIHNFKITLSPDIDGAIEFIRDVQNLYIDEHKINVQVFLGHTNASGEKIQAAIDAGAVGFTHLGNANCEIITRCDTPLKPEHALSNVVKWVLNSKERNFFAELITDKQHISPNFLTLVPQFRL